VGAGWDLTYPFPFGVGLPDSPGVTQTIPSYLYEHFSDDDDLQAFVAAYNALTQSYLNWFNSIGLPVYTGPMIASLLLDWVLTGLYGYPRPVLPSGLVSDKGAYGTFFYGFPIAYGQLRRIGPDDYYATSDDVYKRCATWHFFKGDGKYFSITWLKKRVMRFLVGTDGTAPNIDQTYQVSVTFGPNSQANIRILNGIRRVVAGVYGIGVYGRRPAYGGAETEWNQLTPLTFAPVFKAAVASGALELPFQYTWSVTITG
jgi:hypothetical protein